MARVTVEDCIDKLPNRYELVLVAAQRAKDIGAGSMIMVDRDNDKNSVVALREISENRVSIEDLQESLVKNQQKLVEIQEPEDEEVEIISAEKELAALDAQFSSDMITDEDINNVMQILRPWLILPVSSRRILKLRFVIYVPIILISISFTS